MDTTVDELAGVVGLFGGLTQEELHNALTEVAYRDDGQSVDMDSFDTIVDASIESFGLVRFNRNGVEVLVPGPTSFPTVPDHAEDLPHILSIKPREIDRAALGEQVADRFHEAVEIAIDRDDRDRMGELLDISYDIESWAPISLDHSRSRLDDALE